MLISAVVFSESLHVYESCVLSKPFFKQRSSKLNLPTSNFKSISTFVKRIHDSCKEDMKIMVTLESFLVLMELENIRRQKIGSFINFTIVKFDSILYYQAVVSHVHGRGWRFINQQVKIIYLRQSTRLFRIEERLILLIKL